MFFGRECYRRPETLLRMLGEPRVQPKASSKLLQRLVKGYVYLFGVPEVGFQLRALHFRMLSRRFEFNSALDAGCGIGLYSFHLASKHPSARVDACDNDPANVEVAKSLANDLGLTNVNIFQADLLQLSQAGEYDLILCVDVMEHVEDDQGLVANLFRALKQRGILYLSVPHRRHTRRYLKRFGLNWESKSHLREGYSESELAELLQDKGFRIETMRNTFGLIGELLHEVHMLMVLRLPLPVAGLTFPLLSIISAFDLVTRNRKGYGLSVVAQKVVS